MTDSKYEKYILRDPVKDGKLGPYIHLGEESFPGIGFGMYWVGYSKPTVAHDEAMVHDFDQCLWFMGADPTNLHDFGAEIEMSLGEEGIKHTINTPSIVYIPKGLVHCPLNYKKVDKPFIVIDMSMTPEYVIKRPPKK
jgi:hypothetical protein